MVWYGLKVDKIFTSLILQIKEGFPQLASLNQKPISVQIFLSIVGFRKLVHIKISL